jgi:A/G-specific adenine glycosylase
MEPLPTLNEFLRNFRRRLLAWFDKNARDLPWRTERTPYRVWISEMMLQQTQVQQVLPYYHRFLTRFPTLQSLARAPLEHVLKAWEGMGYYARARNLHKAAQIVVQEQHGVFPEEYDDILKLPGIGPYSAAAIASLAFDRRYAVLDGNVQRVVSRLFAFSMDPRSSSAKRQLQEWLDVAISRKRPGAFNEAMMELGALVCTPKSPLCSKCPVSVFCRARADGEPENYPPAAKKKPRPHHHIGVGLIWHRGRLLIARRPEKGLLGGLWEFPGGKQEPGEKLAATVKREIREELGIEVTVRDFFMQVEHQYSHFTVSLHVFHCRYVKGEPQTLGCTDWRWTRPRELTAFAFPRANGKIIERLLSE